MELTKEQQKVFDRHFKYIFDDFLSAAFYGEYNICPIEQFYADYYDKYNDVIYTTLDWESIDNAEEEELLKLGKREDVIPCWEKATELAVRMLNLYRKLLDEGYKVGDTLHLTKPFLLGKHHIVAVTIDIEGLLSAICLNEKGEEWYVSLDFFEEYATLIHNLELNKFVII